MRIVRAERSRLVSRLTPVVLRALVSANGDPAVSQFC
jgi:hypothetical protein